jgi:NAD(P)-dependent dehydrogenase (short-subunit alcohol dehydrogenase family)
MSSYQSQEIPKEFGKGFIPPLQDQDALPGKQFKLDPSPIDDITADGKPYKPAGKLEGRKVIITGGDSGIGRSIVLLFGHSTQVSLLSFMADDLHLALEGADVTVTYLPEEEQDMKNLADLLRKKTNDTRKFQFLPADLTKEDACRSIVQKHLDYFGGQLDTLICNHGNQDTVSEITELDAKHWLDTFDTNIHSFFYLTKAAVPHLEKSPTKQPTIVFNDSINAFKGHPGLVDYTATKGAILGFARSLNAQLTGKTGIRVNCAFEPPFLRSCKLVLTDSIWSGVAPGPIWTPLMFVHPCTWIYCAR